LRRAIKYLLSLLLIGITALVAALMLPLPSAPLVGVENDFALEHVNIISMLDGSVLNDMTVLVKKGRIINILTRDQYFAHDQYISLPADGKYLIPGLWDMHTHGLKLSPQLHHPLFIRFGVTSVRDMSGCLSETDSYWACPEDRTLWQKQAIDGVGVSPRYPLQSSYQTNGGNEVPKGFPGFFNLATQNDANDLVEFYESRGVDFIKVYTELTLSQYDSLVRASTDKKMNISGHKPLAVPLLHALEAGMASIEHGRLFMFECFDGIESFRRLENPVLYYNSDLIRDMLLRQNLENCALKMSAMAESGTRWVPTLTTLKMSAMANDETFRSDPRLAYIPTVVYQLLWRPDITRAAKKGYDAQGSFVHQDFFAAASTQVRRAQDLGVTLLAGTDNLDTYVFSGASLHDELVMLVEAGLSPLEALQAATINPAIFSGMEDEFGSIAIGKHADFLLLNENPLANIRHTQDIHGVMFAGQYFDGEALHALDNFVVEMAASVRVNLRFLYDILASPLMRIQLAD
jgi:hypothetical protein